MRIFEKKTLIAKHIDRALHEKEEFGIEVGKTMRKTQEKNQRPSGDIHVRDMHIVYHLPAALASICRQAEMESGLKGRLFRIEG